MIIDFLNSTFAHFPPEHTVSFATQKLQFHPDPHQSRVLDPSIRRGILNCCRQWGKSTTTAVKAVHHAFTQLGSLTLVLSPSARQSSEFLRKAKHFLKKLDIRPRGDGDNEISLLLPNGSRIVGLPSSEDTIRGFSGVTLLLIDEAARVTDDLYRAVRPMLATSNGALWLLSTPNGKQGFFHEEWLNLDPAWTRVSVPATQCPRIDKRFLDEERKTLGDSWFRQEYLCEFVSEGSSLFNEADLLACLDPSIQPIFPNRLGGGSGGASLRLASRLSSRPKENQQ